MQRIKSTLFFVFCAIAAAGQPSNKTNNPLPVVQYKVVIDTNDLSFINVEMRISHIQDTFQLAMVAHPEYDDRFWRFIENMQVEGNEDKAAITRQDSALWRIIKTGSNAVIHYRIHLPPMPDVRPAWRPFLSTTGGLIGGPHTFLYVLGQTKIPSEIMLNLPAGWQAFTGLQRSLPTNVFTAPSVEELVDAPILIGHLHNWEFTVNNTLHQVVYYNVPGATVFDTALFVSEIKKMVQQTIALFGTFPYHQFSFLLQDGAYGALEHHNSVTLGAPAKDLASDRPELLNEIAHEYFHAWNLMDIKPVEYGDVTYKNPPPSKGLWWSEGLTLFYADLILRRAQLPVYDTTRIKHLEGLIQNYYGSSGNLKLSPEQVSLASNAGPGALGDYNASPHLQGEVLGAMMDLIIRNATGGKGTIDDVMRLMYQRFGNGKGFANTDIEQLVTQVCNCSMQAFFNDHVRSNREIDFNKYLQLIGLKEQLEWQEAKGSDGKLTPDLRIYAWPEDGYLKLGILDPLSIWGKAGLHTGDILQSLNGEAITVQRTFFTRIRQLKLNDTITLEIKTPTENKKVLVAVKGYKEPVVRITELKNQTARQLALRRQWLAVN